MTKVVLCPNPYDKYSSVSAGPVVELGLLSVATVLQSNGFSVKLIDASLAHSNASLEGYVRAILNQKPDIIGFSTRVDQYARTLQIAKSCKKESPRTPIVLGGPQASITDFATLTAFPFVDVVIRGECEQNISALVKAIAEGRDLHDIPGVTFREEEKTVRTGDPPVVDLDGVPSSDYSLVPGIEKANVVPIEVGRGCPFGCTFCSTKDFFQRRFRFRDTDSILRLMAQLHEQYGIRAFRFVHDNISVSKGKMRELCDGIRRLGFSATWSCSARVDCLDEGLIKGMSEAGCSSVFMGLETGSPKMQQIIGKRLNLSNVMPVVRCLTDNHIPFTASFMMGYPEETVEDLEMTIRLMIALRFAGDGREVVQLHMVAPSPGTRMYQKNRLNLSFDGRFSDQAMTYLSEDLKTLVKEHPEVFAGFQYYRTEHFDRKFALNVYLLTLNLIYTFPYTTLAMFQLMAADFPGKLLHSLFALAPPDSFFYMDMSDSDLDRIHTFLKGFIESSGPVAQIIKEVLAYERIIYDLKRRTAQDCAAVTRDFACDIEGWIAKATDGSALPVSGLLNTNRRHILFVKTEGKVKTTVVPEALAEAMGGCK